MIMLNVFISKSDHNNSFVCFSLRTQQRRYSSLDFVNRFRQKPLKTTKKGTECLRQYYHIKYSICYKNVIFLIVIFFISFHHEIYIDH